MRNSKKIECAAIQTEVGYVEIIADEGGIIETGFVDKLPGNAKENSAVINNLELKKAFEQMQEYLSGDRKIFDLKLNSKGTPFQQKVWQALLTIPYGETTSYQAIAEQVGSPKAVRAVGAANGKNPIGIIVPCHRVIGKSGKLTGYAGGLSRKSWLLNIEQNKQTSLF